LSSSTSNSSSQGTNTARTSVDISSENFDSPEEEVNWITISRKQGKHKPTPPSVPSLLAAPIPPVVPPTNTKQHRQQQQGTTNTKKTTNNSSLVQQKVIPPTVVTSETISTNNKQQQQHTTIAPPRLQNVLKNHASHQSQKVDLSVSSQPSVQPSSSNLWTNNHVHEHTPGMIDLKKEFSPFSFSLFSNTTMLNSASYCTILYSNTDTSSSSCDTSSNRWCIFYSTLINLLGS
jgi:hypothetical protein